MKKQLSTIKRQFEISKLESSYLYEGVACTKSSECFDHLCPKAGNDLDLLEQLFNIIKTGLSLPIGNEIVQVYVNLYATAQGYIAWYYDNFNSIVKDVKLWDYQITLAKNNFDDHLVESSKSYFLDAPFSDYNKLIRQIQEQRNQLESTIDANNEYVTKIKTSVNTASIISGLLEIPLLYQNFYEINDLVTKFITQIKLKCEEMINSNLLNDNTPYPYTFKNDIFRWKNNKTNATKFVDLRFQTNFVKFYGPYELVYAKGLVVSCEQLLLQAVDTIEAFKKSNQIIEPISNIIKSKYFI